MIQIRFSSCLFRTCSQITNTRISPQRGRESQNKWRSAEFAIFLAHALKKEFDLDNEGQGHRLQHSQWSHAKAKIS